MFNKYLEDHLALKCSILYGALYDNKSNLLVEDVSIKDNSLLHHMNDKQLIPLLRLGEDTVRIKTYECNHKLEKTSSETRTLHDGMIKIKSYNLKKKRFSF